MAKVVLLVFLLMYVIKVNSLESPSVSDKNHRSLAAVVNFYNVELLASTWQGTKNIVSLSCRKDVELYLEGLLQNDVWALKMDDASGRYSTGWFWGNHFWTGSRDLCENILPKSKPIMVNPETTQEMLSQNRSRTSREAEAPRNGQSPSYKKRTVKHSSVPPFPLSFFMVQLDVNSTVTSEQKSLRIGLCMPQTCKNSDIKAIMEETSTSTLRVKAVKSQHHQFNLFQDRTFIILSAVTSVVVLFLFIGTSFDFYLEHTNKQKKLHSNEMESSSKTKGVTRLIIKEMVLSFSLRANIRTICDQSVGADTIPVIHGLKSISMIWVILGHTCLISFRYSDNMEYRGVVQKEFFFQSISNGSFGVDTFFFVSGLLVSFLYFRTNAKGKLDAITLRHNGFISGLNHFFGLIFYRFARLTMPYLFSLGLFEVTKRWLSAYSIFDPPVKDHVNCQNYWWRNVLYINTLFPLDEMCMAWSWYLSDDTQFYVIGALLLIITASHFKSGACLLVIFMISSWSTTSYIAYKNNYVPNPNDPFALFDQIYDKPWTRLGPYLIGMCVGWYLFKKNCQLIIPKLVLVLGWTASLVCLVALVFGLHNVNFSAVGGAAYSALSHSAWALSLAWIVTACSTGHGGFANTVLSATILYPVSRVTYCAYLLHPIVIEGMLLSMDGPLHLGVLVMMMIFLGQVVVSFILAFFVSLAFEAPVVSMLRIMIKVVDFKKLQLGEL